MKNEKSEQKIETETKEKDPNSLQRFSEMYLSKTFFYYCSEKKNVRSEEQMWVDSTNLLFILILTFSYSISFITSSKISNYFVRLLVVVVSVLLSECVCRPVSLAPSFRSMPGGTPKVNALRCVRFAISK